MFSNEKNSHSMFSNRSASHERKKKKKKCFLNIMANSFSFEEVKFVQACSDKAGCKYFQIA